MEEVAEDDAEAMYRKLNVHAHKLIHKHADGKNQEEMQDVEEIRRRAEAKGLGMMDVPIIKRLAAKYHGKHDINKKKGIEEHQRQQMETFNMKGQGMVDLHRHLRREPATPLVAVRRKRRGMAKQQAGTIATSPK